MSSRRKQKHPQPAVEPSPITINDPERYTGRLKALGGSRSDDWNNTIANETIQALWFFKNSDEKTKSQQTRAALLGLIGIAPRDELEGMMAAQLIAAHSAAMECYRRAMIVEQTFEGRRENLNQANKLSRTFAELLGALNRHRGKGQQKVTVEHIHVHSGGQAMVGVVESAEGGGRSGSQEQSHAKQITHTPESPLWGADPQWETVPLTGNAEQPLPDARRKLPGGAEGE